MTDAEKIKLLTEALTFAEKKLCMGRGWGGMDWHYNLLHPVHYKPVLEKIWSVLAEINLAKSEPKVEDKRPWRYGASEHKYDGMKYFVESADFEYDVRLYISGNFADDDQRKQYGEWLAKKLNFSQAQTEFDIDERTEFEKCFAQFNLDRHPRISEKYLYPHVDEAWGVWQARAALKGK